MQAPLSCSVCGTTEGFHGSYEEWSDRASELGWAIGEDTVICADCVEKAQAEGLQDGRADRVDPDRCSR